MVHNKFYLHTLTMHELKEMRDLITLYSCKYLKKIIYTRCNILYIKKKKKKMSASISQLQQGVHKRYAYRATPLRSLITNEIRWSFQS